MIEEEKTVEGKCELDVRFDGLVTRTSEASARWVETEVILVKIYWRGQPENEITEKKKNLRGDVPLKGNHRRDER